MYNEDYTFKETIMNKIRNPTNNYKFNIDEICKLRQDCGLSCHNCYFVERCKKESFKRRIKNE